MPESLARDISFRVQVKHCTMAGDEHIVGAAVCDVADEDSLHVFRKLFDFIMYRVGVDEKEASGKQEGGGRILPVFALE